MRIGTPPRFVARHQDKRHRLGVVTMLPLLVSGAVNSKRVGEDKNPKPRGPGRRGERKGDVKVDKVLMLQRHPISMGAVSEPFGREARQGEGETRQNFLSNDCPA